MIEDENGVATGSRFDAPAGEAALPVDRKRLAWEAGRETNLPAPKVKASAANPVGERDERET